MHTTYINIMVDSLKHKLEVLNEILRCSEGQTALLDDPNLEPDAFQTDVERKAELIEKLEELDAGFDSLYQKVKAELQDNKEQYAAEIQEMQKLI